MSDIVSPKMSKVLDDALAASLDVSPADEIQSLRQRVEMLEGALEPFARIEVIEPSGHIVGLERYDFERARAALSPKVQEGE